MENKLKKKKKIVFYHVAIKQEKGEKALLHVSPGGWGEVF